ncbi:MAG: type I-C CRISPR-associated protein Cas8c/Csd1, partial [Butyricicoccus sp.]
LECCFSMSDRLSNAPLDSMFLHGYYCMRQYLRTKDAALIVSEYPQNQADVSREEAFSKLLALENRVERIVLDLEKSEDENRTSNAVRFMSRFAKNPASTWVFLEERMLPYQKKLHSIRRGQAVKLQRKLEEWKRQITENHWNTDEPLKTGWLHFYYVNYYCNKGE